MRYQTIRDSGLTASCARQVGDTVEMITGDSKGESGKIISVDKKKSKLVVEGINMQTKHMKPMKGAPAHSLALCVP